MHARSPPSALAQDGQIFGGLTPMTFLCIYGLTMEVKGKNEAYSRGRLSEVITVQVTPEMRKAIESMAIEADCTIAEIARRMFKASLKEWT